jgi:hypothetical protein
MHLTELFCHVDDFWKLFAPDWQHKQLTSGTRQRQRAGELCESEIMTLLIHFHQASYRNFKAYYTRYIQVHLQWEFPYLVSYSRFVQLTPRVLVVLGAYLHYCFGRCTGISLIDATPLAVCHNRRISQHKTLAGLAQFGFQLGLMPCADERRLSIATLLGTPLVQQPSGNAQVEFYLPHALAAG